jgi:hypothetical protein
MWKAIPKPIRRWLFLAVLVPLTFWGLERLGEELARRRGESTATKVLRAPRRVMQRTRAA